jgi:hypothetical protein
MATDVPMSLDEARRIIQDGSSPFPHLVMATAVLISSDQSTLQDLVACLKYKGLPAETAATALYVRTKRSRPDDSMESIVTDYSDWVTYLRLNRQSAEHP